MIGRSVVEVKWIELVGDKKLDITNTILCQFELFEKKNFL